MSAVATRREVDDLVLQLKGLVHVRALLEARGASTVELDAYTDEISRVRAELARLVKESETGGSAGLPGHRQERHVGMEMEIRVDAA